MAAGQGSAYLPTLTLQAMPGQFLRLVVWDDAGRECVRLPLEPESALRLAAQILDAALAELRARRPHGGEPVSRPVPVSTAGHPL